MLVLLCATLAAQQPPTPAPSVRKTLRIRKFTNVKITVDAKLDEPVWHEIEPITDFVQTNPDEGRPASEKTEVRVFYDDNNIYFGFTCYDAHPEQMTHRFGGHDAFTGSDSINILLDTFHDLRTGYFFSLNSRNSQFDALANEGSGGTGFGLFDPTWDGIWYSATSIESWGWSAEVVIPFKSIRISRLSDQVWGINIGRDVTRKNENDWWTPVSRFDQTARPSKAGTLLGLEGLHVGRNVEVIPYFSTKYRRVDWLPQFNGPSATGGVDVRYGISGNLTASVTANPDFADTEADVFTSDISRFEIFFPEKRKFFTEGANYFTTPLNLFFSRRIGFRLPDGEPQRILEGGKLTGVIGGWTIGALEALTQHTDFIDPQTGLAQVAPASLFGVLRVQHRLGEKSSIGMITVNRVQQPGDIGQRESSHGIDLNILKGDHFSWPSQFMVNLNSSHPGMDWQHTGFVSTLDWNSNRFEYYAAAKFLGNRVDISHTGFEPEVDRWSGSSFVAYKPFINRHGIRQFLFELNYDEANGTAGELEDSGADAVFEVQFKNFWTFHASKNYDRTRFFIFPTPIPFASCPPPVLGQSACPVRLYLDPKYRLSLTTNSERKLFLSYFYLQGRLVEFNEGFSGFQQRHILTANWRAGEHLFIETTGTLIREFKEDHSPFQDRRFLISRWTYQITPRWRARVLAQYENDIHGKNLNINSLIAYDFTARSAFFVGYNRQRNVPLDRSDLGNEVFVKISYLFGF
jgi:uncharacterized protein DUF5916